MTLLWLDIWKYRLWTLVDTGFLKAWRCIPDMHVWRCQSSSSIACVSAQLTLWVQIWCAAAAFIQRVIVAAASQTLDSWLPLELSLCLLCVWARPQTTGPQAAVSTEILKSWKITDGDLHKYPLPRRPLSCLLLTQKLKEHYSAAMLLMAMRRK